MSGLTKFNKVVAATGVASVLCLVTSAYADTSAVEAISPEKMKAIYGDRLQRRW